MATDSVHVLRSTELNHVTCHEIHRAKLQGVLDPMQVPEAQNHSNVKRCTSQTQRTLIRRAKLQGVLDPHASTYYWKRKNRSNDVNYDVKSRTSQTQSSSIRRAKLQSVLDDHDRKRKTATT